MVELNRMNYERENTIFRCRVRRIPYNNYGKAGKSNIKDYELLKASIMNTDGNDITDTAPTFKVLEEGASTLSKEEAGQLAQRQMKFIQHLQAALVRIENKTYGICRETGKLIPKERLQCRTSCHIEY